MQCYKHGEDGDSAHKFYLQTLFVIILMIIQIFESLNDLQIIQYCIIGEWLYDHITGVKQKSSILKEEKDSVDLVVELHLPGIIKRENE